MTQAKALAGLAMHVQYVGHDNDDLLVANAARVSFAKKHDRFDPVKDVKLLSYLARHNHFTPFAHPHILLHVDASVDAMLRMTMNHGEGGIRRIPISIHNGRFHGFLVYSLYAVVRNWGTTYKTVRQIIASRFPHTYNAFNLHVDAPLFVDDPHVIIDDGAFIFTDLTASDPYEELVRIERCIEAHNIPWVSADEARIRAGTATLYVKAPIFVARQLVKHQIHLVWNEVSRRYVDSDPEFYEPKEWRGRPVNKKQGSSDAIIDKFHDWEGRLVKASDVGYEAQCAASGAYTAMISGGVAPEQARILLPQSTMTEWYWTGSLEAFARVCSLRCKPDAQLETKAIGDQIDSVLTERFGNLWTDLSMHGQYAWKMHHHS